MLRKFPGWAWLALLMLVGTATWYALPPKFAGFDVKRHDGGSPMFHFSDSDASRTSPVVISIPGRRLANEDDRYRMELEKVWMSTYVPKSLAFKSAGSALCNYSRQGEQPFCELYEFEDAHGGGGHEYYFYVGNCPVARGDSR